MNEEHTEQLKEPLKKKPSKPKKMKPISRNLNRKIQRRERTKKGLCTICGKPLDCNGKLCNACRESKVAAVRERAKWYKDHGLCPICGRNEIFPHESCCPECRAKQQTIEEGRKEYHRQYQEDRRKKRKELGLCQECGKPVEDGRYRCAECYAKRKAKIQRKQKKYVKAEWASERKCSICGGEPLVEGYRVCQKCYGRLLNGAEKREKAYASGEMERKHSEYWAKTNASMIVHARKRSKA